MIDDLLSIAECVEANAYINAQLEMKNLYFNGEKCHKIHLGSKNEQCPNLKVQNKPILNVTQDKYLGDIISNSGENEENIKLKISNGMEHLAIF